MAVEGEVDNGLVAGPLPLPLGAQSAAGVAVAGASSSSAASFFSSCTTDTGHIHLHMLSTMGNITALQRHSLTRLDWSKCGTIGETLKRLMFKYF